MHYFVGCQAISRHLPTRHKNVPSRKITGVWLWAVADHPVDFTPFEVTSVGDISISLGRDITFRLQQSLITTDGARALDLQPLNELAPQLTR